jgi:transglutaminase superfamily protein
MLTRRARRRLRAAPRLIWLTACAWCGLVAFDIALLWGFAGVHEAVRECRVKPRRTIFPSVDEIVWAVDEACVWYVKRAACLQRSAVTTWLLRRNGVSSTLVIGYRPVPFESHAWVEVEGGIVNDRPQYQRFFTVLERL